MERRVRIGDLLSTTRLKSGRVLGGLDYSIVRQYSRDAETPGPGCHGRHDKDVEREYERLSTRLRENNSQIKEAFAESYDFLKHGLHHSPPDSVQTKPGGAYLPALRAAFKSPYYTDRNTGNDLFHRQLSFSRAATSDSIRNELHIQLLRLNEETEQETGSLPRLRLSHGQARPTGVKLKTQSPYKPRNLGYR